MQTITDAKVVRCARCLHGKVWHRNEQECHNSFCQCEEFKESITVRTLPAGYNRTGLLCAEDPEHRDCTHLE